MKRIFIWRYIVLCMGVLLMLSGCSTKDVYLRGESFIIKNYNQYVSFFEQKELKATLVEPYKESDIQAIELVNDKAIVYRFFGTGSCDILFVIQDLEKAQEVHYQIDYYEQESNIRIRIRSQGIGSGYNDYLLDDLSTPVYGPVTDDGQENQWDYYIKKYVTEEELYDILKEMYEYKEMFQALLDEWEAEQ